MRSAGFQTGVSVPNSKHNFPKPRRAPAIAGPIHDKETHPLDKGTRTFNKETRTVGMTPPAHAKAPRPGPDFGPTVDKMARTVGKERRTVTRRVVISSSTKKHTNDLTTALKPRREKPGDPPPAEAKPELWMHHGKPNRRARPFFSTSSWERQHVSPSS